MDVLNTKPSRRRPFAWLLLSAWLTATACLSWPSDPLRRPTFPHRVHVVDNSLACTMCHGNVYAGDRAGMPPPELCAPCHDRFDADKPVGRRVAAFYDERSRYRTAAVSGQSDDVVFSHHRHVTQASLACTACHADIYEQDEVPTAALVHKPDCMQCHAAYGMANDCDECHRVIDRTTVPADHRAGWVQLHGERMRAGDDELADRCALCHQNGDGCTACHQQMAPRDHNQTFRLRTHGLRASIDRSRCATCHRQDSCEQCHQITRPRSHRGGFGGSLQRHCTGCHFPLADEGCSTCHRSTPGHDRASPLPGDHSPAMNCRLCHGVGQALPHPDGGHPCTVCHR